jgi:CRISPR type III-B/RAMP module RAMP protein Cmr6
MSEPDSPDHPRPQPGPRPGPGARPGPARQAAGARGTGQAPPAGRRPSGTADSGRQVGPNGANRGDRRTGQVSVAGPLGRVVECLGAVLKGRVGYQLGAGANALLILRRVAVHCGEDLPLEGKVAVLRWAGEHALGQASELAQAVAARRDHAVAARVASGRRRGENVVHRRLVVRPMWRMITGLGERANAHEIGIALHGTYGCPVIPGSTLKGVTRAWAGQFLDDDVAWTRPGTRPTVAVIDQMFGPPPPGARAGTATAPRAGNLDVFDALPTGEPMRVTVDGVTPHVQPYYGEDGAPAGRQATAPGEWHNPVPSPFLTVSGGRFAVDVVGPQQDCDRFVAWCAAACDDLGVGAKTGAGYGYLLTDRDSDE